MLRPRAVTSGRLGIFAPSSAFDRERFERGASVLRSLGFELQLHPQLEYRRGFLAGTDDERLGAFHELLADDRVDGIIAARGGYGAHRIVDRIDFDLVKRANKPLLGFSDVVAFHSAIQKRCGLISFHAPVVTQLGTLAEPDLAAFVNALSGSWEKLRYTSDREPIHGGRATGRLTGGCLAVVAPLVGTDLLFLPDDAILLLEDVGEAPYRVDRLLTHLRLAGVLHRVRGVVVGDFTGCNAKPDEQTVDDVLADRLGDLGIPVLAGFPFGHGEKNYAIPLGAVVTLDADARTLVVDER